MGCILGGFARGRRVWEHPRDAVVARTDSFSADPQQQSEREREPSGGSTSHNYFFPLPLNISRALLRQSFSSSFLCFPTVINVSAASSSIMFL